jgi:hypothetical protein
MTPNGRNQPTYLRTVLSVITDNEMKQKYKLYKKYSFKGVQQPDVLKRFQMNASKF